MGDKIVVPTTEDEALAALPVLFDLLAEISTAVAWPHPPAHRSPLELDDQRWSWWPLSSIVLAKLNSATDHLHAVRIHAEAENFHPMATYTLTRAALLSASQAVWLLCDDDPLIRQRRGLFVVREADARRLASIQTAVEGRQVFWSKVSVLRGHIAMRAQGRLLAEHGLPKPGPTTETNVIEVAARAVQPNSLAWEKQAKYQWQTSSSDAHGMMWGSLTRGPGTLAQSPAGLAVMGVRGSPLYTWQHVYVPLLTAQWAVGRLAALSAAGSDSEGNSAWGASSDPG